MYTERHFARDDANTSWERNAALLGLLGGEWRNLDIVKIERIEEEETDRKGWEGTIGTGPRAK